MSLGAGARKDRITLEEATVTQSGTGAVLEAWAPLAATPTVWAALEPLSGREFFSAGQINAEASHRIRLLYRDDLATRPLETAKLRARLGIRIFDVTSCVEAERRVELHLFVTERAQEAAA